MCIKESIFYKKMFMYILLIIIGCVTIGPFLWLLGTSLKSTSDPIYGGLWEIFPSHPTLGNYLKMSTLFPFWNFLRNSVIVSVLAVSINIIVSSLAAYALARIPTRGSHLVFIMILSTLIIPFQLLLGPLYELCVNLGLKNTLLVLVVPHGVTGFGVFLLRQAFVSVPKELDESAFMDGASHIKVWFHILLPVIKPSLVTLAIFSFVGVWGDFLWPLMIVDNENLFTLPLGLNKLNGIFVSDMRVISAGAVMSVIPIIALFVMLQKYFIRGAVEGSVKG